MSELDQKLSPYVDRFVDQTLIELDYPITEENRNIVAKNVGEGGEFYQEFRKYAANEMRRQELQPTLGEYREREPERRAQYLAQKRGMPFQDAYEKVLSTPFSAESSLYGGGSDSEGIANYGKDLLSGAGRSILGLTSLVKGDGISGMATTPESSQGFMGSLLSNPSLPLMGMLGGMAPVPTTLAGRFGLGGMMGSLEAGQKSFRPEGVETGEALTDIGLGALGEGAMAMGTKVMPRVKQTMGKWVSPDPEIVSFLEYTRNPQNLKLMADNLGMETKVAKELVETIARPDIASELESISRSVSNFPKIDLREITKAMREAVKDADVNTQGYAKGMADVDEKIKFIESQAQEVRDNLTNQIISSPLKTPESIVKLRQMLDEDINFDKMREGVPEPVQRAYKAGRTKIKEILLRIADESGDKAYAQAMRDLANKLDANTEMRAVIGKTLTPQSLKRGVSALKNLEGQDVSRKEIFERYDKLFGTDFAKRGQAISIGKKLQMSKEGLPNTTLYGTGQGGIIKDLLTGGPRRTAGIYYPALDAVSTITQTPSLGAVAFPQANQQINSLLAGWEDQGGY